MVTVALNVALLCRPSASANLFMMGRYRVDAIKGALVAAAEVRDSVPSAALDAQHVDRGVLCLCSAAHRV